VRGRAGKREPGRGDECKHKLGGQCTGTSQEGVFLRGGCYALHKVQCEAITAAIDNVLCSPQMDIHMCMELLLCGCLDREDIDDKAFQFLEDYEEMAQGDAYEDGSDLEESF
jgi:hypothetical protein